MKSFSDILLRQFRVDLFEKNKSFYNALLQFKYNYDYSDLCYIVDNIKNTTFQQNVYGCPLPSSISELGDTKVLYGGQNDVFEQEINWILLSIRKYDQKIQFFVDKKISYEKALILGNYNKANLILDEIEKEVCISLWGIEQRFILIEAEKGLKENTKFLNEINEKNKKWFIKRFSHFFSLKAEKELSVNQYNISLARLLFRYVEADNQVDLEYYNFKLNFLEIDEHKLLSDFLAIEGYHSIIDKYISLIRVLQLGILGKETDKIDFIDSRLFYLSKKVSDFEIEKLRLLLDTKFEFNFKERDNDRISIEILDFYTNGNYLKVVEVLENYLINNPLSIELYEIYLKSLILLDKELRPIGNNENSFQNRILKSLYGIILRDELIPECLNEIRKISFNLSSIYSISYYLMNLYKKEVEGKETFLKQSYLNTKFLNPTFIQLLNNKTIVNNLSYDYVKSSSLNYLLQKKNRDLEAINSSKLTENRKEILRGIYYQQNKDYEKAVDVWEKMLNGSQIKDFQKERVLQNMFTCLESLNEYDLCINLYVENYFKNPLLVSNIKVQEIKKKIKKSKYKKASHSLNLPIFYKLTQSEDYDVHTTYECFLLAQDCSTPTELIRQEKNNSDERFIFFLRDICTLDIFKHSPFIISSKHKYNERIAVCKKLSFLDPDFIEEYEDEIERLTKRLIIQKGIQEVDESKIYVNQTGIIETELKNISSLFKRFRIIGELKSEKDISILSLYSDKMFSYKLSNEEEGNEFSKDPQFDIYKDIFYFLRKKFLFSSYGLQQYLSARIRHGVLLGEIRPEFENLNLITEKEKGIDSYKNNTHWDIHLKNLTHEQLTKFQEIFSDFSYKIDELINEEILSKSLQIRIEDENPEGWLDYNFDDLNLKLSYLSQTKTERVEEFVDAIFEELWSRTEQNLNGIKTKINGDIKAKFFSLLLELEQGLIDVFLKIPEQIENNINEARVNIENKLNKIANWFSITESNISDFQIEKIIDVSLEYNKAIYPIKEINCDCKFKGKYYPPLVDLVRIFMDNAIKHSGFQDSKVNFYISIEEKENLLKMQFRNPLAETIDLDKIKSKIGSFSLDLTKSMKERGSGFHKAMRIIESDLESPSNDMSLLLNPNNEFCVDIDLNKEVLSV